MRKISPNICSWQRLGEVLFPIIFVVILSLPSSLFAENAKFDGSNGMLSIPAVEVDNPFGLGVDCYQVSMKLMSSDNPMTFSLADAVSVECSGDPPPSPPPLPDDFSPPQTSCDSPGTPSYNKCQTQRLQGTWSFSYTVDNPVTYIYTLTNKIDESDSTPGQFFIIGTNQGGDVIVASYNSDKKDFALMDMGPNINRFYRFNFTSESENVVSGCAFHITVATEEWSDCYAMTGSRTSRTNRKAAKKDVSKNVYDRLLMELINK